MDVGAFAYVSGRATPDRLMGRGERRAAPARECLMSGLVVFQPLIGWDMVSACDPRFVVAGVHVPPIASADPSLYSGLHETRLASGYALFTLFTLHMLAVLVHVLVLRYGLLARMALWRTARKDE
ncbi:hypothetical protein GCM10010348_71020 [Streptomyces anthocyanicus]|uniref:hypothetical protein n=1 Tax=Streptomyces anthocyanicus TaxID=68174 RepID=UPI0018742E2E|nr:hypothetical protein [Streptomyces anthocyanicus]GHC33848.1 hypothetical protein GCM10010348_71020 [Streptomyces anthocyanicus]